MTEAKKNEPYVIGFGKNSGKKNPDTKIAVSSSTDASKFVSNFIKKGADQDGK